MQGRSLDRYGNTLGKRGAGLPGGGGCLSLPEVVFSWPEPQGEPYVWAGVTENLDKAWPGGRFENTEKKTEGRKRKSSVGREGILITSI